jgi:hypothetical protein
MPRPIDPKLPDDVVSIRDFPGYEPNSDPHDLKPGVSVSQVNATSSRPGELRVRLGTKALKFES